MDLIEFAEKVCGTELLPWQKEFCKELESMPRDKRLVYVPPRCGKRFFSDMYKNYINYLETEKQK